MTIERRPCQRMKPLTAKTFCFLVDLDETRALILDNFVWAVATKAIPIKEWRRDWKTVELPEEKVAKILDGLAAYAIYAGMTPEAAEYLPQLVPMTPVAQSVALFKGEELLERYKTQAAIEEAADKAGKPLVGAALIAKAKKIMADAADHAKTEEHLEATVDTPIETDKAAETVDTQRRRGTKTAKKVKQLADEVSQVLTAAEAKGQNPTKVMKGPTTAADRAKVRQAAVATRKAEAQARAKPFDPTKLKGPDGEYKSVSAMCKGLVLEQVGKKKPLTDDEIFAKVKTKFGLDDSKKGYVNWNRNWLTKEGILTA